MMKLIFFRNFLLEGDLICYLQLKGVLYVIQDLKVIISYNDLIILGLS